MALYRRVLIVIVKAVGAVGEPPTYTLKQASDAAGTGAKALNFTTYFKKSATDLQTVAQFTKVTQAAANTCAGAGDKQEIVAIEIFAETLDTEGGFNHIQISVPDVGATAQLATSLYIGLDPLYAAEPSLTAID